MHHFVFSFPPALLHFPFPSHSCFPGKQKNLASRVFFQALLLREQVLCQCHNLNFQISRLEQSVGWYWATMLMSHASELGKGTSASPMMLWWEVGVLLLIYLELTPNRKSVWILNSHRGDTFPLWTSLAFVVPSPPLGFPMWGVFPLCSITPRYLLHFHLLTLPNQFSPVLDSLLLIRLLFPFSPLDQIFQIDPFLLASLIPRFRIHFSFAFHSPQANQLALIPSPGIGPLSRLAFQFFAAWKVGVDGFRYK